LILIKVTIYQIMRLARVCVISFHHVLAIAMGFIWIEQSRIVNRIFNV